MWFFKKKKKQSGKKDTKDIKEVSSSKIKVKVFSPLGGDIRVKKAEYEANELRNDFGELVSVNTNYNHDEDVNFYMDSIYREMQTLLDFRSKSKKQQEEILDKRIRKQEKLIFFLDKVAELNAFYNYQDEWAKLRDLRILRRYLVIDKNGSYFYIDNGIRTYEFDAIDGFLIPRWQGTDTYSSYPDHTRTKKIKIQEDYIFQKEMGARRFDIRLFNFGVIFFVINMVILSALGFGVFWTWNKLDTLHEGKIQAAQVCMDNSVKLNTQFGNLIEKAMVINGESIDNSTRVNEEAPSNIVERNIQKIGS